MIFQIFSFNKKKREQAKEDIDALKAKAKNMTHSMKKGFKNQVKSIQESKMEDADLDKVNKLKDLVTLASTVMLTITIAGFVLGFIHFGTVNGNSMNDTLYNGDNTLSIKANDIKRNDIVIIDTSSNPKFQCEYIVKRVIGVPGDTIEIKNNKIYINGTVYDDIYAKGITENMSKKVLSDNEVFALGDNREHSKDSIDVGPFQVGDIEWKVVKSW